MAGLFTQGDWGWKKWHVSSGLRIEQYALEGLHPQAMPVGRIGVTYSMNSHHTLRASYVQGYRFPSPAERFVRYTIDQINIYPNIDVVPEQGWNAEVGHKAIWEKEELQVTWDNALFLTRYRNLIEFTFGRWGALTDTLFGLGYKSVNVPDAQIGGWETSVNVNGKYRGWEWHGLGGYTYLLPVDLSQYDGGKNLGQYGQSLLTEFSSQDTASYILRYRFKHMAKFNLDVSKGKWGAGVGWRYYSFMQKVDPVLEWFIPGLSHYRTTQNHGTHILDARVFYHVSDQLSCSIQVQNILNAFYATRPAKPDAPRNLSIQFTWKI
jgi:iron complex outermembrane receptor protein